MEKFYYVSYHWSPQAMILIQICLVLSVDFIIEITLDDFDNTVWLR
ncbi:hypothetical protein YPPY72_3878 [Yersinia pestis PY-72]|nr:hypothetical protein YpAngola_A0954 [Yersinia pestis Angola]EIQ85476.1 hypothetical protein YPPY01_3761 [Yersinia pestis PY-01]EIS75806.1 hypothetical protein YPPY72_3878 [Yersinia pestis PY-72]EIS84676.1 hypothetical protein YPPY76_3636 [Yersinia pestis PY-76]EIT26477.1 hypothetical protein YPPY96_3742 [Yersinia pestis PY-96]